MRQKWFLRVEFAARAVSGLLDIPARLLTVDVTLRNITNTRYRDYMSRYKEFADAPGRAIVMRVAPCRPLTREDDVPPHNDVSHYIGKYAPVIQC